MSEECGGCGRKSLGTDLNEKNGPRASIAKGRTHESERPADDVPLALARTLGNSAFSRVARAARAPATARLSRQEAPADPAVPERRDDSPVVTDWVNRILAALEWSVLDEMPSIPTPSMPSLGLKRATSPTVGTLARVEMPSLPPAPGMPSPDDAKKEFTTDEEAIFDVLVEARSISGGLDQLVVGYLRLTARNLEEDLKTHLTSSEFEYASALMVEPGSEPPPAGQNATVRLIADASRLYAAMAGLGTDEEAIFATLVPYQGSFERIHDLKQTYQTVADGSSIDALENDLKDDLNAEELKRALEMLHGPQKVMGGVAAQILAEVEREISPGTPCSIATAKRFIRAYLDYWYLDGQLLATEELRARDADGAEYQEARTALEANLQALLGAIGTEYLDGGPQGSNWGTTMLETLQDEQLFGRADGRTLYRLIQVIGNDAGGGMPEGVEEIGIGEQVEDAGGETNLAGVLWDSEILSPGDLIQTWRTEESAVDGNYTACRDDGTDWGGFCGHSFVFVEYVYSVSTAPPEDDPASWELIGATGTALDAGGEVATDRAAPTDLKGIRLVGLRIADQRGYHFIPRNAVLIADDLIPDVDRVGWLRASEVWYSGRL